MGWYVMQRDERLGPFEEAEIGKQIREGRLAITDLVCRSGEREWTPAGQYPEFVAYAPATSKRPPGPVRATRLQSLWITVGAISCLVAAAGIAVACWMIDRSYRSTVWYLDGLTTEMKAAVGQLRDSRAPGDWTPLDAIPHTCVTDRSTVTCTVTNPSERPITTCLKGTLVQKEASGVSLEALPMCTGRLEPGATIVLTATWVRGFADDICYKETAYGKVLEWNKCTFIPVGVDLPTWRRLRGVPSKKE